MDKMIYCEILGEKVWVGFSEDKIRRVRCPKGPFYFDREYCTIRKKACELYEQKVLLKD